MNEVKRYQCEYCGKLLAGKKRMEDHETECVHNQKSINCFRCEFAYMDDYEQCDGYNSTVQDVPQCIYIDDKIECNDAPNCEAFRRSDKLNIERSYDDANKNYEDAEVIL